MPAQTMGFGKQNRHPCLHGLEAKATPGLDGLLQQRDGLDSVFLFKISVTQDAYGVCRVDRILRQCQAALAGCHASLRVATRCLDPSHG